jgi:hypothetical protein
MMRISLHICILLMLAGICCYLPGQGRFKPEIYIEAGSGVNLAYFDVGGGSPGMSVQGGVLYDLGPSWKLGAAIGIHRARGTDAGTSEASRGYEFRSNLNEISARGVYVLRFQSYPAKKWKTRLEPRAYAGLGILQFQPKPNDQMATQGNGDFLPVSPFISGGLGLGYALDRDISLLLEGGSSISTSDYLEGYSDPGNTFEPDLFFTLLFKFIYKVPSTWN